MRVKNLIIGNITKIGKTNNPIHQGQSVFYKVGSYAIDLKHFGCYKLVKKQDEYPDKIRDKKVVIYEKPFGALSIRNSITRHDALEVYENRRVK